MPNLAPVHAGLLRETVPGERRVVLTPEDVGSLSARLTISFERGCGTAAGYEDEAYIAAGAQPANRETIARDCNLLVSIRKPLDVRGFAGSPTLIFLGSPLDASEPVTRSLLLDLARLEGIADAGSMDVATRQATICGHAAVLEGARQLGIGHPMLVMDGSQARPVKMAALGAGAAAMQAIATAKRLGALTYLFGFTDDERERAETLGAKFVTMDSALRHSRASTGDALIAASRKQLAGQLREMQLIVSSAGGAVDTAPILIDDASLPLLTTGTVIIDLEVAAGGNCAMTKADEIVARNGIRILGTTTLASVDAHQSSRLFSEGVRRLLERVTTPDGRLRIDGRDLLTSHLSGERFAGVSAAS
ncbi:MULTISPECIES: Rossmann-fold NAD(P)-binding domain-containing protein [unclassified Rhizobium]|uniref:NAD/NADP transhydrogenase subunit alpha n=1 Tax=unclassified Rhizobium TaxID=2613769 RepID=UPI001ADAE264|nr:MULTISPECIES: NAD/NADP transhydrogenase subunit alpha [unclassified Rhizobium]MBO9125354.1 NAD/NADP transhydrogenase subunit alpha [Rhizobium sp. 16-488-2b]MBO9175939.1 NAD/NADP transhydrogenase subunit alpha [Rhizobium sp. 16-488-2a]